ncbi:MAG: HAMP domain-containing protein [Christensenellaceae bacterium]|nr:HAMP domain-containing protein [Christensenellaceae bacterium]
MKKINLKLFNKKEEDAPPAVAQSAETPAEKRRLFSFLKKGKKDKKPRVKKERRLILSNIKIAPRLLAGFLIIAFLSTAVGVYAAISINGVSGAVETMYSKVLLPTKTAYDLTLAIEEQISMLRQAIGHNSESMMAAYASTIRNRIKSCDNSLRTVELLIPKDKMSIYNEFVPVYEEYKKQMEAALEMLKSGNIQALTDDLYGYGPMYSAMAAVQKTAEKLHYAMSDGAAATATANKRTASTVLIITISGISLIVVLSVVLGVLNARSISRPVKQLTRDVKRLADGEMDINLDAKITKDEIGQMREAVNTIVRVMQSLAEDTGMLVAAAAEGDLSVRADAERHTGVYRRIVEGINATLDAMIGPIHEATQVLGELSMGHLSASVTGDFKGDFSLIKNALNSTIATLQSYIQQITFALSEIAKGNLTVSIDSEFNGDFAAIKESFNKTVESFRNLLTEIDNAAGEVAMGTAQLSAGSQTISQGAAEQAGALEQLTASLSQISAQTSANAESANTARDLSQQASTHAAGGNSKMQQLQKAMEEIHAASANISKIIKVIDDIAFQTNILALNAAVEAAHAGAHGKGFAVVAEEVRKLAARSAEAAKETTALVEGSIAKTNAGAKIAHETAAALEDIVRSVEQTAALAEQIAVASNEQAEGVAQVNKGIEQLSQVVQNNSATAEEAAASSEQLSAQAEHLKQMVGRFQLTAEEACE